MRRTALFLVAAGFAILAVIQGSGRYGSAQNPAVSLPGARPIIEAARYASIQAAIDALPKEGGVVKLPPGTFEISAPLQISQDDVLFEGCGGATHIKNVNTSGEPALIVKSKQPPVNNTPVRPWRVQLADFRITGNEKSGHGIMAQNVNEIFITGVTCSYHGKDGIHFDDAYEDPRVCNSLITYNKQTGLNLIGCHDIVVSGTHFEENFDALRCSDGFNLCMTGCCLDDHLGHGVVIENTYGSVVSGNMIEECRGTGVILDRDCYGITISANVIAHNGAGVDLRDAHGCAVSANTFTINHKDALRVGSESGRITVAGNNFSNTYVGQGKLGRPQREDRGAGIVLDGTSDVTINGNLLSSVRPSALSAGDKVSRRIMFTNNLIVDSESEQAKLQDSMVDYNLNVK